MLVCPHCKSKGKRVQVTYNVCTDHYQCPVCQREYDRVSGFTSKLEPVHG